PLRERDGISAFSRKCQGEGCCATPCFDARGWRWTPHPPGACLRALRDPEGHLLPEKGRIANLFPHPHRPAIILRMTDLPGRRPPPTPDRAPPFRERIEILRHLGRLVAQIWRTSKPLPAASIGLRLVSSLQPIAMLYVGKL